MSKCNSCNEEATVGNYCRRHCDTDNWNPYSSSSTINSPISSDSSSNCSDSSSSSSCSDSF